MKWTKMMNANILSARIVKIVSNPHIKIVTLMDAPKK